MKAATNDQQLQAGFRPAPRFIMYAKRLYSNAFCCCSRSCCCCCCFRVLHQQQLPHGVGTIITAAVETAAHSGSVVARLRCQVAGGHRRKSHAIRRLECRPPRQPVSWLPSRLQCAPAVVSHTSPVEKKGEETHHQRLGRDDSGLRGRCWCSIGSGRCGSGGAVRHAGCRRRCGGMPDSTVSASNGRGTREKSKGGMVIWRGRGVSGPGAAPSRSWRRPLQAALQGRKRMGLFR